MSYLTLYVSVVAMVVSSKEAIIYCTLYTVLYLYCLHFESHVKDMLKMFFNYAVIVICAKFDVFVHYVNVLELTDRLI